MTATIPRLPRKRSYSERPSTFPLVPSERPAPNRIASGPAMPKKATVAMKLMNVAAAATGRGIP